MSSGKILQFLYIFPFSAIGMMFVLVCVGGYGGLSESRLCVFCELCSVSFLVVGECLSVLLWSVVLSYVNCGDDNNNNNNNNCLKSNIQCT